MELLEVDEFEWSGLDIDWLAVVWLSEIQN